MQRDVGFADDAFVEEEGTHGAGKQGMAGVSQRLPERMARLVKEVSVTSPFFTMMMSSLEPFCASSSLSLVRSRLLKE